MVAFAVASLPAGAMGNWVGLRRSLIIGLLMAVLGGLALPLAPLAGPAWTPAILMSGVAVIYIGIAVYFVNAVPFVAGIASLRERNTAFSMQTALLSLSGFLGALIGGFLPRLFSWLLAVPQSEPDPYRYPLFAATIILVPAVGLLLAIRPSNAPSIDVDAPPTGGPTGRVEWTILTIVLLLSTVRFFQVSGVAAASTFFNLYMDTELHVPTMQIGIISASARLIGFFLALITPIVVMRYGAPRAVMVSSTLSALGLVPLALFPLWTVASLGYIGVASMSSMRFPAYMLFCMDVTPARWRGMLAGLGETFGGVSFALMALVGGYIIEQQGFPALFLLGSGLALVGNLLFYLWFMLPRTRRVATPAV
jgi:MFS family permease